MTQNGDIACQRFAFTPEEKLEYESLRSKIFDALVTIEELDNGYCFVFNHGDTLLHELADWMPLEHKCCPFLMFSVNLYATEYVQLGL